MVVPVTRGQYKDAQHAEVERELEKYCQHKLEYERKRDRVTELFRDDLITKEEFMRQRQPLLELLSSLDKEITRCRRKLGGKVPSETVDEAVAFIEALNHQIIQLRQSFKRLRMVIDRLDVRAKLIVDGDNLYLELRSRLHPDVARLPVRQLQQPGSSIVPAAGASW